MREPVTQVCVYIFQNNDSRSPKQRLAYAVEQYCGTWVNVGADMEKPIDRLHVERTQSGKPYFPDCPQLHFSISHSGEYWACAVADVNVGLDLQEHVLGKNETKEEAAVRFRRMAHRFFHPLEAEFVELESFEHFFTVWTAREAYVKNTGQGIDKYFSEHCVVPRDRKIDCCWTALGKWFRKTEYKMNYSLCICAEEAFLWNIQECQMVNQ